MKENNPHKTHTPPPTSSKANKFFKTYSMETEILKFFRKNEQKSEGI